MLDSSQELWQRVLVVLREPRRAEPVISSGDDQLRSEQRHARSLLFRLALNEELAQKWQRFDELYGRDLAAWQVGPMKRHFAETYRRVVGVSPLGRHELRRRLLTILEQGINTVDAAIEDTNRLHYANGVVTTAAADDVFA